MKSTMNMILKPDTRFALVALCGPPNAGKSSLLNALLGEKVAPVTPRAQTTRRSVRGIWNSGSTQIAFVDTPGILKPSNLLEQGMRDSALEAIQEADWVLALASPDTEKDWVLPEGFILPPQKCSLVLNKADAFPKEVMLACAIRLVERFHLREVLNVSALKKKGLDEVKALLESRAPKGPWLFPEDEYTDQTLRQSAAEIVRERALMLLQKEVPHSLAVAIESYKEREDGLHEIEATLYIERESQKPIVIGRGGSMLKKIGTESRLAMEKLAGAKVHLKLWVKVRKNWKEEKAFLKELGLGPAKGQS